jgi:phage-related protein
LVVAVPSWATSIIVSRASNGPAALALQDPMPNPGASAVTINGITINLDFSEHNTIYLDCDLHDAYYEGGGNANKMVSFTSSVVEYPTFPGLSPGENSIIPNDGAILDFELTPRWWTL